MKSYATLGMLVVVVLVLSACSETKQTAGTRKADTSPYAIATGTHSAKGWQAGDMASWERHLASRAQMGQNEYTRTGSVLSESAGTTAPAVDKP